jgi:nucleoside-diphosphate-sugar epimerase
MLLKALVTGGGGFIGSHLVDLLLKEGWQVRILDNFSTGSPGNLLYCGGEIDVIEGDIRDKTLCESSCRDVDAVFHLAGMASVGDSVADPLLAHEVNLTGTLNMLLAARDAGVRRFVFSSSTSVYGNADTVPTKESQIIAPLSPYASQKATGEFYCKNFHALYGLETVILRYFNVFGPRQSATSGYAAAIPKFVQASVNHTTPIIYGDGQQTRDFVYAGNVALANLRAAQAEGVGGQAFNIAGGNSISLLDLLAELRHVTGSALIPDFQPARAGDVRHSRADITKAKALLGYEPEVSFAEGIRRTVEEAKADRASAAGKLQTLSQGTHA